MRQPASTQRPRQAPGVMTRSKVAAGTVLKQRLRERPLRRSLRKRTTKTRNMDFVYNDLNAKSREIRLCTVQPGAMDDPLACTLTTVSLDDDQEYETISYQWGDPTMNKEVLADGSIIRVTTNLHTLLRYLRKSDKLRVLWVDGICINQCNIDERAYQVSIMGDIYRKGRELQIWLGEVEEMWVDDSPELVSEMQRLDREAREVQVRLSEVGKVLPNPGCEDWAMYSSDISMQAEMLQKWLEMVIKVLKSLDNVPQNYQLDELMQVSKIHDRITELQVIHKLDRGFSKNVERFEERIGDGDIMNRVPTLSTATGASKGPNVPGAFHIMKHLEDNYHLDQMPFFNVTSSMHFRSCPDWRIALKTLAIMLNRPWWTRVWIVQEVALSHNCIVHVGRHEAPLSMFLNAVSNYRSHVSRSCYRSIIILGGNESLYSSLSGAGLTIVYLEHAIQDQQKGGMHLRSMFSISSQRKATDPHDHIYAFRGLLSRHIRAARPDYQTSISLLYASSTLEMFASGQSIDLLQHAVGVNRVNPFYLPSWSCDWSRTREPWMYYLYNACKDLEYMAISDKEACLTVEGFKIGTISSVSDNIEETSDLGAFIAIIERWWDMIKNITHLNRQPLWAMLLLGYSSEHDGEKKITPVDMDAMDAWWDRVNIIGQQEDMRSSELFTLFDSEGEQLVKLNQEIVQQAQKSTFYVTSQGHIGIGPRTLQQGDRIFVVKGSHAPLILRPLDGTPASGFKSEQQSGYQFVDVCYVHGIMHGEAVKRDTKWQQLHLY